MENIERHGEMELRRITRKYLNELSFSIIGCAIEVHRHLGPGLLESVYQPCFIEELKEKSLFVEEEVWVPINYKGKNLGGKLKLDLIVEKTIIIEIKAVEAMIPLYEAQLLSYLRLTDKPKGLLMNFHSVNLSSQVISLVTEEFAKLPEY